MLAMEGRPPETVIAHHPATRLELTLHAAAVNAVMAGCLPEYFPIIVAAFEAMDREPFNFHGSTVSTGGSGHLLIVSGPVVDEIGNERGGQPVRAGQPRQRDDRPDDPAYPDERVQDRAGHRRQVDSGQSPASTASALPNGRTGIPGRRCAKSWATPTESARLRSFAGAGFCNVENHGGNTPEAILDTMANAMANYGCISTGQSVVVLSPEHAEIVARPGWTKTQVREYLFEHAKHPREDIQRLGKLDRGYDGRGRKDCHRGIGPDDILVTVGGGDAGGHSSFIPSWSRGRGSIMQTQSIGVCIDC